MQHLETLPKNVCNLSPIIVSSPTTRCGTTLLQRLLCSSRNGLIFGEFCALDMDMYLEIFLKNHRLYQKNRQQIDASLAHFKLGELNNWIFDLSPELDTYLPILAKSCFLGLEHCETQALALGRTVWGFKKPSFKPESLSALQVMMPNFKLLYIFRDVFECAQSGKARGALNSLEDFKNYSQFWVQNLLFVLKFFKFENMLVINYRHLIEQPDVWLERISSFTGMEGMDKRILDVKVNAPKDGANLAGYIEPVQLGEEEWQVVENLTANVRKHLLH